MKKALLFTMLFFVGLAFIGCTETSTTATGTTAGTTAAPTTVAPTTQTTTVVATTDNNPVISGADDITIMKNSTFVPLAGVTATDVEDGVLTDSITYSGNVNPMAVGVYTATYTVVDSDGNITTVDRTVTVEFTDTQAPLLAGAGNITIYVGADFDPLAGVTATDTVDGTVTVTSTGTVDVWTEGDYVLAYSATDAAGNEATTSRTVTVSYGDFVYGAATDYVIGDLTLAADFYSTPIFSGGVINDSIAAFTYVKVMVDVTAATAGTIDLDLDGATGSIASFDVTGAADSFEVIYVIDAALVDATFNLDTNGLTISALDISVMFAEVRDMIAPVLNVPTDEVAIKVNSTQAELDAILDLKVTALDDIDGNVTNAIALDLGLLDLTVVGAYDVIYSVSDAGGNESTFTRTVIVGNAVDSGVVSDPTFQNNGDGLFYTKNSPAAAVSFDATAATMEVLVTDLGWGPSYSGAYFKVDSNTFDADQWYVLTFTVKSSVVRQMGFRMGLITDQANGWVDDFNGVSDMLLDLTTDYTTFNYYFKLDSVVSSNGTELFIIELNLGAINYSSIGKDGTTTFKDFYISKVVTSYEAPTYEEQVGADLPTTFAVGDVAKDWAQYVSFKDMSGTPLTATVDATAVNMAVAGTYDILFSATDSHDMTTTYTLTITVLSAVNADTVGPVVTKNMGANTSFDQFTSLPYYLNEIVTANDAVDGIIAVTPSMVSDGGLNLNVAGVYTVTFNVYDSAGNITVFTVDITINDKEAPHITANDFDGALGDAYDATANLSVNDNIDGVIDSATVVITGLDAFITAGVISAVGEFEVVYTVSDAAGNEAVKTITVFVSDIEWNESTRVALGTPDEGPTHSTAIYDAVAEATVITAIDTAVDSWDHAKWVYYLDAGTDLVAGMTYKFEITVKADIATDLYFRVGSTLYVDPWIDNFTGGLRTVSISSEYATYSVIFTVDKDMPAGSAKFQFMYGYLSTDATNTIYVKSLDLVQEKLPEFSNIADMYSPDEVANSTISYNLDEAALVISNMVEATYDWDSGRLVYYIDEAMLTAGQTYRIQFTAKSDVATEIRLRIGSTLWVDPWIDNFTGGLKTVNVGTDYTTFELVFTVDKAIPNGNAKFQFMYGYLATDEGNSITIKDFMLQELGPVFVNAFDLYTPNETAHSTVVYDALTDQLNITDMVAATYDWDTGRLVYYIDQADLENGETYKVVFTLKAATATEIHLRIGSTLWVDPWIDNFDGGLKTINVSTEFVTYEFTFTVDKAIPNGNAKFQFMYGYLSTDAGNSLMIKDFYLQEEGVPYSVDTVLVDDFSYADEAAFEVAWTERINGVNTSPSDLFNLDALNDAFILELPAAANNGWLIARRYETLANLGATADSQYLAFYLTNNTNVTTASVWLYWSGNQNAYTITLPAIGESGWAYVDISASGHTALEITDFGLSFNNWAASPVTGSLIVYQVQLVKNILDLVSVDQNVVIFNTFESYVDNADYQAITDDNMEGSRISGGAFIKTNATLTVNGDNTYLAQNTAGGTNGIKIRITKAELPSQVEYIAIWVQASDVTGMVKFQSFKYTAAGGYAEITSSIIGDFTKLAAGTYVYIPVSALSADTVIISLVVNCGSTVVGQLYFDNILLTSKMLAEVNPINAAPVVTISDANKTILSGMTFEAGIDLNTVLPTLLGMIDIADTEDGAIAALETMITLNGLDLTTPAMGSYTLEIVATDSFGAVSNTYELAISIVSIVEDFEAFTDDADFKANWSMLNGFRVSGSGWLASNGTLVTDPVEGNSVSIPFGAGATGAKINITKTYLEGLNAEYVGFYFKTSTELTGNRLFQGFTYTAGGYASIDTLYGDIDATDEGTYLWIKVSDLPADLTGISVMINVASGNSGTLTFDNIVVK
ncbi:MAG: DUF5011 domain-containing protein [Tenericutes bacterium]|nr:DUF5011 domain-containing protein [Mycoplasmatota bacterium]